MERPARIPPLVVALLVALVAAPVVHAQAPPGAIMFIRETPRVNVTDLTGEVALAEGERGEARFLVSNVGNLSVSLGFQAREFAPPIGNASLGLLAEPGFTTLAPGESLEVVVHLFAFRATTGSLVSLEVFSDGGLLVGQGEVPVAAKRATPPQDAGGAAPPAAVAFLALALGAGGVWALLRSESRRILAALALAPLYTRLTPSTLLDQEKREALHRIIGENPGINYSELKRRTGLPAGVLVHHLRTLERHRLVASRRDGALRRYAAASTPFPAPEPAPITPMQRRVLEALRGAPLTQRQLAEALGVSQQGANRHVKALERRGLLAIRFEGGEWRCHALAPSADIGA